MYRRGTARRTFAFSPFRSFSTDFRPLSLNIGRRAVPLQQRLGLCLEIGRVRVTIMVRVRVRVMVRVARVRKAVKAGSSCDAEGPRDARSLSLLFARCQLIFAHFH